MVEGLVEAGQTVVVIEDLISTGSSSIKAVEALRDKGCNVKGLVAIFSYGFDVAKQNFKQANCDIRTLCDYGILIEQALKANIISEKDLGTLRKWRDAPDSWGQ
jgi:orotate phosphoribosyltransferase